MTAIFENARLGPVTLRNRVIKAATFEGRTPRGLVTDELVDFHRAIAAGGAALTTLAYCAVAPEGRTARRQIHMRPAAVAGLTRLTEAVHTEGAAVAAQLGHAGPVADARSNRAPALAPSRTISPLTGRIIRAVAANDLTRLIAAHAQAAAFAVDSGFDAVELHFGHNYLVSSFFSPLLNRRRDGWGGSLTNRARFAREIAEAVRTRIGDRIAVTAKLNMDDAVPGGLRPAESLQIARLLEGDGHLDALELTAGSSLLNPMYYFHGTPPTKDFAAVFPQPLRTGLRIFGRAFLHHYPYTPLYLLPAARRFRAGLTMPLILLGGITDHAAMRQAIDEGFEFVAMGRALLMEPDLVSRIQASAATTSRCVHCNRCMPTIYTRTRCPLVSSGNGG
jgi:2,4-dienoyl-CoA reductase-like NADH-dependent reductase (Old Yellow Enzyme family)